MVNKFLHPAGGAETYMFQTGNFLKKQGYEVQYFGMEHPDNIVGNRWNLNVGTLDFHKKGLMADMVNPFKIIYSREAEKKMMYILRKFQPDIVHLNNFNYQLTPSIIEAADTYRKNTGTEMKIIYTAHDPQLVCPNHYLYRPQTGQACEKCLSGGYVNCIRGRCIHGSMIRSMLGTAEAIFWKHRKVYSKLDCIICPSEYMKEKLDTDPYIADKTVVLRNFVRPVSGQKKKKGSYILYFGRYSQEKGIRTLLDVCTEMPDIPFLFAGGGPLEEMTEGIPNVKNIGFLNSTELDQVIAGARFSICPSECNENCPFSVIESIMNGTPVLGAVRGGIPELIHEGRTGWLFRAGSRTQLKEKIRYLWESDEPEIFADFCRKEQFDTLEEYGKKLLALYCSDKKGVNQYE